MQLAGRDRRTATAEGVENLPVLVERRRVEELDWTVTPSLPRNSLVRMATSSGEVHPW